MGAGRFARGTLLTTLAFRRKLRDEARAPGGHSLLLPAAAGLAGLFRGLSRPAPIVIWSSKIAELDPTTVIAASGHRLLTLTFDVRRQTPRALCLFERRLAFRVARHPPAVRALAPVHRASPVPRSRAR